MINHSRKEYKKNVCVYIYINTKRNVSAHTHTHTHITESLYYISEINTTL